MGLVLGLAGLPGPGDVAGSQPAETSLCSQRMAITVPMTSPRP